MPPENEPAQARQQTPPVSPRNSPSPPATPPPLYHMQPPAPGGRPPMDAIWDAEAAIHLRKHHRIYGEFAGTLPKHMSQNHILALPLLLSHEEASHARAVGILRTVADNAADYTRPSHEAVRAFEEEREADVCRQVEETVDNQREERRKRALDNCVQSDVRLPAQKKVADRARRHVAAEDAKPPPQKRKREPSFSTAAAPTHGVDDNALHDAAEANDRSVDADGAHQHGPQPAAKRPRTGIFARLVSNIWSAINNTTTRPAPSPLAAEESTRVAHPDTPQSSHVPHPAATAAPPPPHAPPTDDEATPPSEQHAEDVEARKAALRRRVLDEKVRDQARASAMVVTSTAARADEVSTRRPVAPHARTDMSAQRAHARQTVFEDLHARGFTMTCGAKFGADFLAYAADPQLVHGVMAVVVVEAEDDLSPRDVVALGRLGDATRKRAVLAWLEAGDGEPKVEYLGVQWEETLP